MLKILYAASNTINSSIQLDRFLKSMVGQPYSIKIAAYKDYSPNVNIDWTLDCLQNMFKPELISLDSENFATYYQQVKYYSPDLIISDMEYYSSEVAATLGITLWQCSSSLINFALTNDYKYNLGLFKKYAFLMSRNPLHVQRLINIQENSNSKYVYSHFGDCLQPPSLTEGYEWIRPYHHLGRTSIPCQHHLVGATLNSDKKIIHFLNEYNDSVCFTNNVNETYSQVKIKDINNIEEYYCNILNSDVFVCNGQTSLLADAFYNSKYVITIANDDLECLTNIAISEKLGLSQSSFNHVENQYPLIAPQPVLHGQFLHEKVMEL